MSLPLCRRFKFDQINNMENYNSRLFGADITKTISIRVRKKVTLVEICNFIQGTNDGRWHSTKWGHPSTFYIKFTSLTCSVICWPLGFILNTKDSLLLDLMSRWRNIEDYDKFAYVSIGFRDKKKKEGHSLILIRMFKIELNGFRNQWVSKKSERLQQS